MSMRLGRIGLEGDTCVRRAEGKLRQEENDAKMQESTLNNTIDYIYVSI